MRGYRAQRGKARRSPATTAQPNRPTFTPGRRRPTGFMAPQRRASTHGVDLRWNPRAHRPSNDPRRKNPVDPRHAWIPRAARQSQPKPRNHGATKPSDVQPRPKKTVRVHGAGTESIHAWRGSTIDPRPYGPANDPRRSTVDPRHAWIPRAARQRPATTAQPDRPTFTPGRRRPSGFMAPERRASTHGVDHDRSVWIPPEQ